MDAELTLAGLLVETHRALACELARVHARHGLQGSDFDALLRLQRSPGQSLRMRDLAAQTGLSTSGVTTLADRLCTAGWVRRDTAPGDRRSIIVTLTPVGAEVLARDIEDLLPVIRRLLCDPLGPDGSRRLAELLTLVRDVAAPGARSGADS